MKYTFTQPAALAGARHEQLHCNVDITYIEHESEAYLCQVHYLDNKVTTTLLLSSKDKFYSLFSNFHVFIKGCIHDIVFRWIIKILLYKRCNRNFHIITILKK